MIVYIGCFTLSILCLYIAEEIKLNKLIRNLLVVFAISLPILVAAFRADNIGTDVQVYVKPIYKAAMVSDSLSEYFSASWFSVWTDIYVKDFEYGFSLIMYITAKVTRSFRCILGVIEMLIIVPIYLSLKNFGNKTWMGMFVFYFMFYNISLNLMRQMIACAFCLLAYTYLMNGNRKKYFAWNIAALFFHTSAIIGFSFYIIYSFIDRHQKRSNKKKLRICFGKIHISQYMIKTSVLLMLMILCLLLMPLLISLARMVLGNTWYLRGDFRLMPNQFLIRLPILFTLIFWRKNFSGNVKLYSVFLAIQYVELTLSQLAGLSDQTIRIVYYFSILNVIMVPYLCQTLQKANRIFGYLYFDCYFIFYWLYYFVYLGTAHTVPYLLG